MRPLPLEQRLLPTKMFGLGRMTDHFLSEYLKSLLSIMEGQFRGKGAPGGAAGVVALLQASEFRISTTLATIRLKALFVQFNLFQATLTRARAAVSSPNERAKAA